LFCLPYQKEQEKKESSQIGDQHQVHADTHHKRQFPESGDNNINPVEDTAIADQSSDKTELAGFYRILVPTGDKKGNKGYPGQEGDFRLRE